MQKAAGAALGATGRLAMVDVIVTVIVMVDAGLRPSGVVDGRFAPGDVVDRLRRGRRERTPAACESVSGTAACGESVMTKDGVVKLGLLGGG